MYTYAQLTFDLFDLIQFVVFLAGAFGVYWKLNNRVSMIETEQNSHSKEFAKIEKLQIGNKMSVMDANHAEHAREILKLDKVQVVNMAQINTKLEELMKAVARLEGSSSR